MDMRLKVEFSIQTSEAQHKDPRSKVRTIHFGIFIWYLSCLASVDVCNTEILHQSTNPEFRKVFI